MIRFWALCALFSSLLFISNQAFSHQEKAAITQVLLNDRSGLLEIAHRFYIHDAEHAVKLITGKGSDIFESREIQATFYEHVISNFSLIIDHQRLELEPIGFEMEGRYFWAYQEVAFTSDSLKNRTIEVHHSSLQEFWPDQINTVNVESGDHVKTAIVETHDELIRLEF